MQYIKHIRSLFFALCSAMLLTGCEHLEILNPQGILAAEETRLLIHAVLLMLIVVIPAIALSFFFAWRYRASNKSAAYTPDWSHNTWLELFWWAVPICIIAVLATITWISTHKLDPYRPIASDKKPLTIQVVALDWRWLFIYPEEKIATVNFVEFPKDRPIKFLITADAPMNSFQITQLAGQIYAMAGMQTKLHIKTANAGDYKGLSTSYSGNGFSNMYFIARVVNDSDFAKWVKEVKQGDGKALTWANYQLLAKPHEERTPPTYFKTVDSNLYVKIMSKYMGPVMMGDNDRLMPASAKKAVEHSNA